MGRYDIITLYLEGEKGKIGLPDLKGFNPRFYRRGAWCYDRCQDAIHLFPYHLNEILDIAKKFDPDIEKYRKDLEKERDEALLRFKLAYEDHLTFIKEKGITIENPTAFGKIESARIEEIKAVLEAQLREDNKGWFKGCLGEYSDKTVACFNEKSFQIFFDAICTLINNLLESNLEQAGGKAAITCTPMLLSMRSLKFNARNVRWAPFAQSMIPQFAMFTFERLSEKEGLIFSLLDAFLKELERGKEIAYYNPSFGYGSWASLCLFC